MRRSRRNPGSGNSVNWKENVSKMESSSKNVDIVLSHWRAGGPSYVIHDTVLDMYFILQTDCYRKCNEFYKISELQDYWIRLQEVHVTNLTCDLKSMVTHLENQLGHATTKKKVSRSITELESIEESCQRLQELGFTRQTDGLFDIFRELLREACEVTDSIRQKILPLLYTTSSQKLEPTKELSDNVLQPLENNRRCRSRAKSVDHSRKQVSLNEKENSLRIENIKNTGHPVSPFTVISTPVSGLRSLLKVKRRRSCSVTSSAKHVRFSLSGDNEFEGPLGDESSQSGSEHSTEGTSKDSSAEDSTVMDDDKNSQTYSEVSSSSDNGTDRTESTVSAMDNFALSRDCVTNAEGSDRNSSEVWMHRDRQTPEKERTYCFVCQSMGFESLIQCPKKWGSAKCGTRYHPSCIKAYNAGDFNVEYRKMLTSQEACPLHHCDSCWFERKKCTAVSGDLIQCSGCYRSFHDLCRPAGDKVSVTTRVVYDDDGHAEEVKIRMTQCHIHSRELTAKAYRNPKKALKRLPFCCECEERNKGTEALLRCSQCIRSFHKSCSWVDNILGNRYDTSLPVCESCIHGETVRIGQPLICKFENGFYPCEAVPWNVYPEHKKGDDALGHHYGKPGYVAVRWGGCTNMFNLVAACSVVPMFEGSYQLMGKSLADSDIRNSWKEMDKDVVVPRPDLNVVSESDKYQKIKTSVYHPTCEKPKLEGVFEEDGLCACPAGEKNRCGIGSGCINRHSDHECPESCEQKDGGCQNRHISKKEVNPNIATRSSHSKGFGVFATSNIPKGSFIAEYAGELIDERERKRRINLSASSRNDEEKHYMMALSMGRTVDCKHKGNIARFLNHSCDPNCQVVMSNVVVASSKAKMPVLRYDKRCGIWTIRDVTKGEELCFNYDMGEYSSGHPIPECLCRSENCTGKLGKSKEERIEERKKRRPNDLEMKKSTHKPSAVENGSRKRKDSNKIEAAAKMRKTDKHKAKVMSTNLNGLVDLPVARTSKKTTATPEKELVKVKRPRNRKKPKAIVSDEPSEKNEKPSTSTEESDKDVKSGGNDVNKIARPETILTAFVDEARNRDTYIDKINNKAIASVTSPSSTEKPEVDEEEELTLFTPDKQPKEILPKRRAPVRARSLKLTKS